MAKPLPDQIEATATRLAQLQARQRLKDQVEKARARKLDKRQQAKTLAALLRSADAHRKIEVGGVVIAAGADGLDPAELCGWLLTVVAQRAVKPDAAHAMRERGLQHFAERERLRGNLSPRHRP
jgi:hypothetical protein